MSEAFHIIVGKEPKNAVKNPLQLFQLDLTSSLSCIILHHQIQVSFSHYLVSLWLRKSFEDPKLWWKLKSPLVASVKRIETRGLNWRPPLQTFLFIHKKIHQQPKNYPEEKFLYYLTCQMIIYASLILSCLLNLWPPPWRRLKKRKLTKTIFFCANVRIGVGKEGDSVYIDEKWDQIASTTIKSHEASQRLWKCNTTEEMTKSS